MSALADISQINPTRCLQREKTCPGQGCVSEHASSQTDRLLAEIKESKCLSDTLNAQTKAGQSRGADTACPGARLLRCGSARVAGCAGTAALRSAARAHPEAAAALRSLCRRAARVQKLSQGKGNLCTKHFHGCFHCVPAPTAYCLC